jgi:LuxR family maltose regulon positive regulatory protein
MEADDHGQRRSLWDQDPLLVIARGNWTRAEILAERGRSIVRRARLEEYVTSVLLYAVAARTAIDRGEPGRAREDLVRVQRLRPQITHALPLFAAQMHLELVRAHIALADLPAARAVLAEVDELLDGPDMDVIRQQADELTAQLDTIG